MSDINELIARRDELSAQRNALEEELSRFKTQERQEAVARIKALMAEHGVTLAEITTRRSVPKDPAAKQGHIDALKVRRKVEPKYRHPETGQTWSGRGLKPRWLVAAITSGQPIDRFKLDQSAQ